MGSPKAHARAKAIATIWGIVCAAYFVWEALGYRGIFARLAEMQFRMFGTFVPFVTYLALLVVSVAPALLLVWLLRPSEDTAPRHASFADGSIEQAKRLRFVMCCLGAIAASASLAFVAYATALLPRQQGKLQTIAISEVGSVGIDEGPARLVGGELGTIVYFGHDWLIGDAGMAFAPYRPASGSDGLARVFVALDARDRSALASVKQQPSWSGILVEGGLPGSARVLFNSLGVGVSTPHFTLYRTAYAMKIGYWLQAIQWMILALFLGLVVLVQSRRINRMARKVGD